MTRISLSIVVFQVLPVSLGLMYIRHIPETLYIDSSVAHVQDFSGFCFSFQLAISAFNASSIFWYPFNKITVFFFQIHKFINE